MKAKIIGYRDWARKVFDELRTQGWEIDYRDTFSGEHFEWADYDVLFFVGWSTMIPERVYREKTCIVVHPSPLPRYRGGSPIQHQILEGETVSAVTLFKLDADFSDVDSGPICWQAPFSLEGTLAEILERIVATTVQGIAYVLESWPVEFIPQYGTPTVFKRRKPKQSEITAEDLERGALYVHNKIRALQDPYPRPWIRCGDGRRLYILETLVEPIEEEARLAAEDGETPEILRSWISLCPVCDKPGVGVPLGCPDHGFFKRDSNGIVTGVEVPSNRKADP